MNVYYNINKTMWAQIEFEKRHKYCPGCKRAFSGTTTLLAFHPNPNDEDEVYRYYYDNNYLTCQCGFKCQRTELISEEEVNQNYKSVKLNSPVPFDSWGHDLEKL